MVAVTFACVELRACDEIKILESLYLNILESLDEMWDKYQIINKAQF